MSAMAKAACGSNERSRVCSIPQIKSANHSIPTCTRMGGMATGAVFPAHNRLTVILIQIIRTYFVYW